MVDQHMITEALRKKGYQAKDAEDGIIVSFYIETTPIVITCKLGSFFPYEFPSVYLSKEQWDKLPSMPHKYTNGGLCLFDKSVSVPNFKEPIQLVTEVIEKTKEVLLRGINKENRRDYVDEFLAYWDEKINEKVECYVEDISVCKELYWLKDEKRSIIAESIARGVELLEALLGDKAESVKVGLLIPTRGNTSMSIPKDDLGFIKLIQENTEYWGRLNAFVQKNLGHDFFLIVSEKNDGRYKMFGWSFKGTRIPNGFRKGHANLLVTYKVAKEKGMPLSVVDCSQRRLFSRGGDGSKSCIDSVVIIGCGSVGGFSAEALESCGVTRFLLVDNEEIEIENIARHVCGHFWVGYDKVLAVKKTLQFHNPNVVSTIFSENAYAFLEREVDQINSNDLLILSVASVPVEFFLVRRMMEGCVKIPVLILWTEPYAYAGHAILLNKPQDIFEELFDSRTLEYRFSVLRNPEQYNLREAGCHASYMPYSAFSLREMIYRLLGTVLQDYINTGKNYRLTWCGQLSEARRKGYEINGFYSESKDYSVEIERID